MLLDVLVRVGNLLKLLVLLYLIPAESLQHSVHLD